MKNLAELQARWHSTNPFDRNYKQPNGAGVYAFIEYDEDSNKRILYIGSSKELSKRLPSHEVLRTANVFCYYIKTLWINSDSYISLEYSLINHFKPILNKKMSA